MDHAPITPRSRLFAILALVLVNLLWGISFPVVKMTNIQMERVLAGDSAGAIGAKPDLPWQLACACFYMTCRFALALLLLRLFFPQLFRAQRSLADWIRGAWTGVFFSVGLVLQVVAMYEIPASRSGFLTSLAVVFTPLIMIFVERRVPRIAVIVGIVMALAGTALIAGLINVERGGKVRFAQDAWQQIGVGDALTITAAALFAGQIILINRFSAHMRPECLTPGMFAASLVVGILGTWAAGLASSHVPQAARFGALAADPTFWGLTAVASVFCTVAAFYLMNRYQPFVSPAHAALLYTLEPVFATAGAMVLPDLIAPLLHMDYRSEHLTTPIVIGGIFIVIGNAIAAWPRRTIAPSTPVSINGAA